MNVAERIAKINAECAGVWGQSGLNQWQRDRLKDWENHAALSPKQEEVLVQIEKIVFGDDDE